MRTRTTPTHQQTKELCGPKVFKKEGMFLIGILAMYWMQVSGYAHGVVNAFDAFCLNIATADRLMHLFFLS